MPSLLQMPVCGRMVVSCHRRAAEQADAAGERWSRVRVTKSLNGNPWSPAMADRRVTRQEAEAALVARDWLIAERYAWEQFDIDVDVGLDWVSRLETEAQPIALGGDKYAQGLLGNVHIQRYLHHEYPSEPLLATALRWFAEAGAQDGGEPMIEEVRHWYVEGKAKGFHLEDAERFLRRPDIAERYKRYCGRDVL